MWRPSKVQTFFVGARRRFFEVEANTQREDRGHTDFGTAVQALLEQGRSRDEQEAKAAAKVDDNQLASSLRTSETGPKCGPGSAEGNSHATCGQCGYRGLVTRFFLKFLLLHTFETQRRVIQRHDRNANARTGRICHIPSREAFEMIPTGQKYQQLPISPAGFRLLRTRRRSPF